MDSSKKHIDSCLCSCNNSSFDSWGGDILHCEAFLGN